MRLAPFLMVKCNGVEKQLLSDKGFRLRQRKRPIALQSVSLLYSLYAFYNETFNALDPIRTIYIPLPSKFVSRVTLAEVTFWCITSAPYIVTTVRVLPISSCGTPITIFPACTERT